MDRSVFILHTEKVTTGEDDWSMEFSSSVSVISLLDVEEYASEKKRGMCQRIMRLRCKKYK